MGRYSDTFHDHSQLYRLVMADLMHHFRLNPATANISTALQPTNLPSGYIGRLFLGRDEFLETLRQSLLGASHATAITQKAAVTGISGLGGIGKTHAAVAYADRHREHYTALLFASADTPEKLRSSLANLCGVLHLDEDGSLPPDEPTRMHAALDWLATHPGWLIIIDNVDDETAALAVQEKLGQLTAGHVLITSRIHGWSDQVENIDLSVLTPPAAADLLLQLTKRRLQDPAQDPAQALILANLLDGLPLAIHQAAGFINEGTLRLADYITRYQEEAADLLTWFSDLSIQYERPEKLAPRPVLITWKTSFEKLSQDDRFWLLVFSHFAPDPIPRFLLQPVEAATPELKALIRQAADAITHAGKYCLLTVSTTEPVFKIHRLVQQITRLQASEDECFTALEKAISLVFLAEPGNSVDVRSWPKWNPLQPHAAAICEHAQDSRPPQDLGGLLSVLGSLYYTKSLHGEAEKILSRALKIDRAAYGEDHPDVAICLNDLAQLLQATNRLAEAEPLMRDALRIDRAAYGEDHPEVAIDLNNLAQLLQATNRLAEAEPLMRDALRIDRAAYGEDHPNVASQLNNLARLLQDTNRLAEAEPLMRDALRIDRAAFGDDHPDVAIDLNNLATLLLATNRLTEVEPLMRDALRIDRAAYGEDHPNVANHLNNLATLLHATNRLAEAEPLMRDALRIFHASLGPEHPKTVTVSRNLDRLLAKMAAGE